MFGIGVPELILILVVGLIVFGPGKLPEMGRSLGKGLREFRKASNALTQAINAPDPPPAPQPAQTPAPQPIQTAQPVQEAAQAPASVESAAAAVAAHREKQAQTAGEQPAATSAEPAQKDG
ncbi:MAG: twin-arginine translocase TatA/TatE family subunit [Selenomonas artemidis]|nr:twin-arginine translocase TatA/TatE family subunit [Selenomonas artemidis]